jgi:hypothetical protein
MTHLKVLLTLALVLSAGCMTCYQHAFDASWTEPWFEDFPSNGTAENVTFRKAEAEGWDLAPPPPGLAAGTYRLSGIHQVLGVDEGGHKAQAGLSYGGYTWVSFLDLRPRSDLRALAESFLRRISEADQAEIDWIVSSMQGNYSNGGGEHNFRGPLPTAPLGLQSSWRSAHEGATPKVRDPRAQEPAYDAGEFIYTFELDRKTAQWPAGENDVRRLSIDALSRVEARFPVEHEPSREERLAFLQPLLNAVDLPDPSWTDWNGRVACTRHGD